MLKAKSKKVTDKKENESCEKSYTIIYIYQSGVTVWKFQNQKQQKKGV